MKREGEGQARRFYKSSIAEREKFSYKGITNLRNECAFESSQKLSLCAFFFLVLHNRSMTFQYFRTSIGKLNSRLLDNFLLSPRSVNMKHTRML